MSVHFSNNGKINDLTMQKEDTAQESSRKIKGMSPHSDHFQSINLCIYRDGMDDASKANLSWSFWSKKKMALSWATQKGEMLSRIRLQKHKMFWQFGAWQTWYVVQYCDEKCIKYEDTALLTNLQMFRKAWSELLRSILYTIGLFFKHDSTLHVTWKVQDSM